VSEDDGRCPVCGGEMSSGYGFAGGGGIGGYTFCLDCDLMVTKQVDVPGESFVYSPSDGEDQ